MFLYDDKYLSWGYESALSYGVTGAPRPENSMMSFGRQVSWLAAYLNEYFLPSFPVDFTLACLQLRGQPLLKNVYQRTYCTAFPFHTHLAVSNRPKDFITMVHEMTR